MSTLADRIREAAEEIGGLNQLSRETNISRRTIGNWLAGRRPKPEALSEIARVTGVRLEWLLNDNGPKFGSGISDALAALDVERMPKRKNIESAEEAFSVGVGKIDEFDDTAAPPVRSRREDQEWLFGELGKIVVAEHRSARLTLPPEKVAVEAGLLYHELLTMVRNVVDRRTVEAVLPLLAENLRVRLRKAAAAPGTGKREAS